MADLLTKFKRSFRENRLLREWKSKEYAVPPPATVKHAVLRRHNIPGATWIETGTAIGDTTSRLAEFAPRVISIEPQPDLHAVAQQRFRDMDNVELICATSEKAFPRLLSELNGDVCFWLDGHYSGGPTFQAESDTPITVELEAISQNLSRLGGISVLIDDIRCFNPNLADFEDYPPLDFIVDWARKNDLKWHIEHDIFVATAS